MSKSAEMSDFELVMALEPLLILTIRFFKIDEEFLEDFL